jgi:hypothetical protein
MKRSCIVQINLVKSDKLQFVAIGIGLRRTLLDCGGKVLRDAAFGFEWNLLQKRRRGVPCRRSPKESAAVQQAPLTDPRALAAVNRQDHSCDELRFVRSEEQRGVGDVPRRSHLPTKRNA